MDLFSYIIGFISGMTIIMAVMVVWLTILISKLKNKLMEQHIPNDIGVNAQEKDIRNQKILKSW